jgi:hypothetical protein
VIFSQEKGELEVDWICATYYVEKFDKYIELLLQIGSNQSDTYFFIDKKDKKEWIKSEIQFCSVFEHLYELLQIKNTLNYDFEQYLKLNFIYHCQLN